MYTWCGMVGGGLLLLLDLMGDGVLVVQGFRLPGGML